MGIAAAGGAVGTFAWGPICYAIVSDLGWRNFLRIAALVSLVAGTFVTYCFSEPGQPAGCFHSWRRAAGNNVPRNVRVDSTILEKSCQARKELSGSSHSSETSRSCCRTNSSVSQSCTGDTPGQVHAEKTKNLNTDSSPPSYSTRKELAVLFSDRGKLPDLFTAVHAPTKS